MGEPSPGTWDNSMPRTLDEDGGVLLGRPFEMQTSPGPPLNEAEEVGLLCRPWRLTEAIALEIPVAGWAAGPRLGFVGARGALPCLKQ